MRIIVCIIAAVGASLPSVGSAYEGYNPVRPDPSRYPRQQYCVEGFARNDPDICNFVGPATRESCREYRITGSGHVEIRCPEDRPGYRRALREAAVGVSCGERSHGCNAGFFEYRNCLYEVIPDGWRPAHFYQVRLRDLDRFHGVDFAAYDDGEKYRRFERRYVNQQRRMKLGHDCGG